MTDKEMLIYATAYRSLTKVAAEISNNSEDQKRFEIIDWLIKQAEKTEKYREALEFYADENNYFVDISKLELPEDIFYAEPPVVNERGIKARKALEVSK